MRWKKWLIIIGIVLAILAVRAHYVVMRGYWYWSVPDSLLARVIFDGWSRVRTQCLRTDMRM